MARPGSLIMEKMDATNFKALVAHLTDVGQEHLLAYWDELGDAERIELVEQIEQVDFEQIATLHKNRDLATDIESLLAKATSPEAFRLDASQNRFSADEAFRCGAEKLATGRVGVMLVAGGQGTRLGFDHPKGMFQIGPISGKTLLQIHIEKVIALGNQYGHPIPLFLMTSPATHDETVDFLAQNDRFGLAAEELIVFCQGTMPAVDEKTGKVLLAEPGSLALSPDGHGGMLAAFDRSGGLAHAKKENIDYLFYFQVDNPMVDIGDEILIGYHCLSGSNLTTEVVAKQNPLDRVGNVVQLGDRLHIVEYSDLPEEHAKRRKRDGSLEIWAGSIAVHLIDINLLAFSAKNANALPFHIARKKVCCYDTDETTQEPIETDAIKFERFIFDLLPLTPRSIVVEIDPAAGFAPLKNGLDASTDNENTVRQAILAEHRRWLTEAGCELADGVDVEISPLFARNQSVLQSKADSIGPIAASTVLE
jgi:UDP-N-acetylglucosamine/UDP-N-acetylgalactosamine diphosphorylase